MFENIMKFFKKITKKEDEASTSKDTAKERLHLVLMQDRANVSADFLELMKQEIIEVIKKYIEVDENAIDVRLTNKENSDGTNGAPALYANIPIVNIKDETRKLSKTNTENKVIQTEQEENEKEETNKKEKNKENKKQESELKEKEITTSTEKTEKENESPNQEQDDNNTEENAVNETEEIIVQEVEEKSIKEKEIVKE